ncbi:MAG: TRAP transporter small permease [Thiolinea sp.]
MNHSSQESATATSGITRILDRIDRVIARLEEWMMAIGVILMAVNTITNVVSRFVFNHSIVFAEELNSIFILLVTFAGIGYAARHGRHIRMSAIYDAMPDKARKLLMTVITAVTAFFMLLLAWFALQYILDLQQKGRILPGLGMPVYIAYLWVPVGFLVTGIQYALTFWKNLRNPEIYLSTNLHEHDVQEVEV